MSRDGAITIVYTTTRGLPRFDWFADSLARQLGRQDEPEVIFVDACDGEERRAQLAAAVADRFAFRHVLPKPSPYRGPHRLTCRDFFAAASARNTGLVYATGAYVVFVDDVSVLGPDWWRTVRSAAAMDCVVAGAYQKRWDMVVEDGVLVRSRLDPSGIDSRWRQGKLGALEPIGGGQLYGCSFGAPRELLLAAEGLDELCDGIGGEDYQLGLRLEWSGARIFYSLDMLTIESEELHRQPSINKTIRLDSALPPDEYMRRLRSFGPATRSVDGSFDCSHMVLDIAYGTRRTSSVGNYYRLSELTPGDLASLPARFPCRFWFDDRPLAEL